MSRFPILEECGTKVVASGEHDYRRFQFSDLSLQSCGARKQVSDAGGLMNIQWMNIQDEGVSPEDVERATPTGWYRQ